MATNLLWFVMAGFLIGFATSTLWEWFYFRKERLKLTDRRIRELEAKLRDAEVEPESTTSTFPATMGGPEIAAGAKSQIPTVAAVTRERTRTSAWSEPAYRSPGVFLESEEVEAEDDRAAGYGGVKYDDVEYSDAEYSDEVYGPANRDNPSTLPSVDKIAPKSSTIVPAAQSSSQPVAPTAPSGDDVMPRPGEMRGEAPTPADALRAKRNTTGRSRQELLAALRRNSEAVQRGEFPPPESRPDSAMPPAMQSSSLVSPVAPDEEAGHDVALLSSKPAPLALPPARQRWLNDPKLTARTKEFPDDLSKIRGIGDVYKQRLYRAGIYTWKQIVETDTETLRRATSAYPSSNVEEWLTQAEALMEKHGRKHAVYSGPPPDDMTKILGIGPVGATVLYRAGICTYEQLASTSKADLEALFPIAVAGDVPDFDQWIERATLLADEKHRDT